ncbi:MAG: hypothetical protein ABSG36_00205 [Acidimicrobiales bacterium]
MYTTIDRAPQDEDPLYRIRELLLSGAELTTAGTSGCSSELHLGYPSDENLGSVRQGVSS